MNKSTYLVNVILTVAVIVLFVLQFTGKKPDTPAADKGLIQSENNAVSSDQPLIAWVNIDSLLNNLEMYNDLHKQLETKGRRMETEMAGKSRAFEQQVLDLQDKVQKGTVSMSMAKVLEQDLAVKERELYQLRNEFQVKFAEEEQVALGKIQASINDFLKEYNTEKGYHFILSNAYSGPVLFAHPTLDITAEVLAGLNAKYQKEKQKTTK